MVFGISYGFMLLAIKRTSIELPNEITNYLGVFLRAGHSLRHGYLFSSKQFTSISDLLRNRGKFLVVASAG